MIIEFSAIPGSGKTALSYQLKKYLETNLNEEEFSIYTREDISTFNSSRSTSCITQKIKTASLILSILNASLLKHLFYFGTLTNNLSTNFSYMKYYLHVVITYVLIREIERTDEKHPVFILDEGFLQSAILYLQNHTSDKELTKFFSAIDTYKKVNYSDFQRVSLFVDSSIEVNYERIEKRKKGWPSTFKHFSSDQKKQILVTREAHYRLLKLYANETFDHFIEIDNSDFHETESEHIFSDLLDKVVAHYSSDEMDTETVPESSLEGTA